MLFVALALLLVAVQASAHEAQPYQFGYSIKDKHGQQHRQETSSGPGSVKGSYGYTDEKGIHRRVEYIADQNGFRAHVKTNEPGTAKMNPAAVQFSSSNQQVHVPAVAQPASGFVGNANNFGLGSGGMEGYNFPGYMNLGLGGAGNSENLGANKYKIGYGLENMDQDVLGYADLFDSGLGYNGFDVGSLNGYSGGMNDIAGYQAYSNVVGNGGLGNSVGNGVFGNSLGNGVFGNSVANGVSGKKSLTAGSGYFSNNGKYSTALVGGNVKGYDSRYSNIHQGH